MKKRKKKKKHPTTAYDQRPLFITVVAVLLTVTAAALPVVDLIYGTGGSRWSGFFVMVSILIALSVVGLWGMRQWAWQLIALISAFWLCAMWFVICSICWLIGEEDFTLFVEGLLISGIASGVIWYIRQLLNENPWKRDGT